MSLNYTHYLALQTHGIGETKVYLDTLLVEPLKHERNSLVTQAIMTKLEDRQPSLHQQNKQTKQNTNLSGLSRL